MPTSAIALPADKIRQFVEIATTEFSNTVYIDGIFFVCAKKPAFAVCKELREKLDAPQVMVLGLSRNTAVLGVDHEKTAGLQRLVALA